MAIDSCVASDWASSIWVHPLVASNMFSGLFPLENEVSSAFWFVQVRRERLGDRCGGSVVLGSFSKTLQHPKKKVSVQFGKIVPKRRKKKN